MKYFSHLQTAIQLVDAYRGKQPFGDYAREFFRSNKKYGSTDRKQVMQLCYAGFRTGKAMQDAPTEKRILAGLFLCSTGPNILLQHLQPAWNEQASQPLEEKIALLDSPFDFNNIFPWQNELSDGIDATAFTQSFLVQPDLFLRLRPGLEDYVKEKLQQGGISYREIGESSLALPNASKADALLEPDREAVVQDLSSQRVGNFLQKAGDHLDINTVWDCCAGSGGKSIMAYDILNDIHITVSDIRLPVLDILAKRFETAGIKSYSTFTADLASDKFDPQDYLSSKANFDLIIADVPCTGSGTWSRSPEHLHFFDIKQATQFSEVQRNIVANAIPLMAPGGAFLYITCSVFKKENEDVVSFILKQGLKLTHQELLKGYNEKADTLFAALFTA